jgi:hypothetical protein
MRTMLRWAAGAAYYLAMPVWLPAVVLLWVICYLVTSLHRFWEDA